MSEIDVRRQALREIAKEEVRMRGKVLSEPSFEEEDKEKQQQETQEESMPFKQVSPDSVILEKRRGDGSSFDWAPFAPWKKERAKKKQNSYNTAGLWCAAKRMIAEEWREAKGVRKRDYSLDFMEREAAQWREKQEEERRRQEEARAGFEVQRVKVDEALKIIGRKILEEKDNLNAKGAAILIEDAMGAIGKVYNVEWRSDGCDIWIEPWEERWPRQRMRETLPVIYRVRVNGGLEMTSYDLIEDEDVRRKVKEEMLANQIGKSLDEEFSEAEEEDIKDALEKKIAEAGRLVELKKWKENSWIVIVEPWNRMKIRNLERNGQGPIETETIVAKVVEGTIITAPINKNKSWERKGEQVAFI